MRRTFATIAGLAMIVASPAFAQSTGGSPNDPNNARNQFPAPSASSPTDPAAESFPLPCPALVNRTRWWSCPCSNSAESKLGCSKADGLAEQYLYEQFAVAINVPWLLRREAVRPRWIAVHGRMPSSAPEQLRAARVLGAGNSFS